MDQYLKIAIVVLVCLVIFLVAGAVAAPLRRRMRGDRSQATGVVAGFGRVLGFMLRPLFVLGLTQLTLWLLAAWPDASTWIEGHDKHIIAWQLIWLGVLVLFLLEGLARQFYVVLDRAFPIPDLLLSILRSLLILGVVFAALRVELGINLAPLLASTALLTAVIGFALQGVLGNLLAGMSLHIVKTVIPGDWAIIGDIEGKVIQTNWRETRLRTRAGHMLIVPNSKVSESLVNNMTKPTSLRRHKLHVGASYSDAPDEVIEALVQAARSVPEVQKHPSPDAFIVEYQDFGINYRLRFWTNQYFRRPEIEGDVCRMIWYQFKRRGIEIPFPMSDQLLNDFMAVVYHQRHLQPEQKQLDCCVADLLASDFQTKLCVDSAGEPLLNEDDYRQIAPAVKRLRFTHGETLFRQGDEGETFYVVARGKLRGAIQHEKGMPATEFELGPGTLLGEMSLMTGLPRTATVTVAESSELLLFDRDAFGLVLSLNDEVPEILSRLVAERAAQNIASFEKIQERQAETVVESLKQENILKRFLRMITRG